MPWVKQFNVDEVLLDAQRVFWDKGFEGATMADLLGAMGIHKGSFYATFESKEDLFAQALSRYIDDRIALMRAFKDSASPTRTLVEHLDMVLKDSTNLRPSKGGDGCFAVNSSTELSSRLPRVRAILRAAFASHENAYRDAIVSAQAKGELAPDVDPVIAARTMMAMVVAMRVMSKAGVGANVLQTLRDQAVSAFLPRGDANANTGPP